MQTAGLTSAADRRRAPQAAAAAAPAVAGVAPRLCLVVGLALAAFVAALLALVLWMCDGRLIYSLDDPYISLSLGRHIWRGQYGINVGEAASPASSVLYPLLLAGFGWARWQDWVPLVLNAGAAIATGAAFAAALCRYGIVDRRDRLVRGAVLMIALCLAMNTVGLVFSGLEHSLHALTSVVIVFGLARALEEDKPRPLLPLAIVLAPLWRFEGLALALLAILALGAARQWRAAAAALAGIATTLAAYMAAMHALGLPPLPSSVLTKSAVTDRLVHGAHGPLEFALFTLHDAWRRLSWEALPVCGLTLIVLAHPLRRALPGDRPAERGLNLCRETLFAGVVAGALAAHILFGAWGWFARYEDYAVALGAAGAIVLWRRPLAEFAARARPVSLTAAALVLLYAGSCYVLATIRTPAAAREVYEQQFQMHRFAVDFWRRPVGVNDLGWVDYRNPDYVLDLWGLGSEAARRARARGEPGPVWLDRLVRAHAVGLVMIYDPWFAGQLPPGWRRLAVLHTTHHVVDAFNQVAFYATSPAEVAPGLAALRAFQPHLLAGTSLDLTGESRLPAGAAASAAR